MKIAASRVEFAFNLKKCRLSAITPHIWFCLIFAAILGAADCAFAVQGSFVATGNATVQAAGPRTGFNGTDFLNIESTANGTFASYGVIDIPLNSTAFPGTATGINGVTLQLTENNAAFSAPGQISVFYTSNTAVSIANTVTNGVPDSPLRFIVGPGNSNVNTDTVGPTSGPNSLLPLSFLGAYQFTQTGSGNNGLVDSIALSFSPAQQADLLSKISSGGTLRLVLTPDTPAPTLAAATYGGATNFNPNFVPKLVIDASVAGLPYWDPNGSAPGLGGPGVWSSSASNKTFTDSTGTATPTAYDSSQYTIFTGSNRATVTVDAGGISIGNLEFDSNGYTIKGGSVASTSTTTAVNVLKASETTTIKSKITGTNGFTKTGAGTLVLAPSANDSDFTGGLNINSGTVIITGDSSLGDAANAVVLGGGTLKIRSSTFELTSGHALNGTGGALTVLPGGTLTIDGPVNTTGSTNLPVNETLILANSTRNLGGLSFTSTGTLTAGDGTPSNQIVMNGTLAANSPTGTTTVNGFLNFTSGRTITVAAGGKLVVTGGIATNFALSSNLTVNGGGTVDIQGDHSQQINAITMGSSGATGPTYLLHDNQSLGQVGTGQITMFFNSGTIQNVSGISQDFDSSKHLNLSIGASSGFPATFSGNDIVFEGAVNLFKPSSGANGITVNNNTTLSGGWTASLGSTTNATPAVTIAGTGSLTLNGTLGIDVPVTVSAATLNINGGITSSAANFTITNAGKVIAGVDNAINPGSTLTLGESSGNTLGTFDLNGHSQTVASLRTLGTGASVITNGGSADNVLSVLGGTNTFAGIVKNGATNKTGLSFSGATETLTGANTFTGGLSISNGQVTFSTAASSIGGALQMGGAGSSTLVSNFATASLNFTGNTTLSPGASTITDTAGTVSLGAITRLVGSTLTVSGSSVSTTAGGAGTGVILTDNNVAFATFSTTDWAAKSSTAGSNLLVALPAGSYTNSGATSLSGNADIVANVALPAATPTTITSLRYKLNDGAAHTVNLGGNTLTVGGILGSSATATAATTLTISNGSLMSAGAGKDLVVIQNGTAPMTISAGIINNGSATGLTKAGSGELILSGANSYTGTTNVNAGKLTLSVANAVSTGPVVLSGGTLSVGHANALDGGGSIAFQGGALQYTSASASNDYSARIHNSTGPINIDTNNQSTVAFASAPDSTNTGGLTKSGLGKLTLNGSASGAYTGPVTLAAGTLSLAASTALPASGNISFTGGTLQYTGASSSEDYSARIVNSTSAISIDTNGNDVTFGSLNTTTPANTSSFLGATNTGGLTKLGANTLTLLGADTFTGTTTISAGTLLLGNTNALASSTLAVPAAGAGTVAFASQSATNNVTSSTFNVAGLSGVAGATLTLQDNAATPNPITLAVNPSSAQVFAGNLTGPGGLTKLGTAAASTLTLTGTNTYLGPTNVTGTLILPKRLALYGGQSAQWTADNITVNGTSGVLQINVGDTANGEFSAADVRQLSGLGTATTGFLTGSTIALDTTNVPGGTFTYGNGVGEVLANTSGILNINKLGAGTTLELTSANTFSGAMRLTGGTLLVSNALALQNSTLTPSASTTVTFKTGVGSSFTLGGLQSAQNLILQDNAATPNPINLSLGANTSTMSGNLSQPASGVSNISKIGTGTLTLSGTNTYTGTTTVSGGTLLFGKPLALYNGASDATTLHKISVSPGATLALALGTSGTTDFTAAQISTLYPNLSSQFQSGSLFGLSVASGTISQPFSAIADVGGNVLGLAKLGSGTLKLDSANTYSGITNASAGVVLLANANAVQNSTVTLTAGSGVPVAFQSGIGTFNLGGLAGFTASNFALQDNASTPAPVTISVGANNASTTFFGVLSGAGGLTKVGSGDLTLTGQSLYTGATTVGGTGSLILGVTNALTTTSGITLAGGTLGSGGLAQDFTINNGGLSPVKLSLSSSSKLDLGAAASTTTVPFGDSHTSTWTGGAVLGISNWTYGTDHLIFGLTTGGLSNTQLSQIKFDHFAQGASISTDPSNLGEVTPLIGDIDQNSVINANDVTAMLTALTDINAYQQSKGFTSLDVQFMLDVNRDGAVNNADIQPELDLVASGGVVAPVPEPSACVLAFLGIIGFTAVVKLHSTSKLLRI